MRNSYERELIKTIDLTQNGLAVPEVDELTAHPAQPLGRGERLHEALPKYLRLLRSFRAHSAKLRL